MPLTDEETKQEPDIGDEHMRRLTGISKKEESEIERRAHKYSADGADSSSLEALKNAESSGGGKNKDEEEATKLEKDDLAKHDEQIGDGYKQEGSSRRVRLSGRIINRRNAIIGTGGVVAIIGGFSFFGIVQGPFQLTHFAQLLTKFHLSSNEQSGNSRTTKIVRWLKYQQNPENTRLSTIGNKIADKYIGEMRKVGFDPVYSKAGYLKGYAIGDNADREALKKQGLDISQMSAADVADLHPGTGSDTSIQAGTDWVDTQHEGSHFNSKTARFILTQAGYSRLGAAVQARPALKRFGVAFHPFGYISKTIDETVAKYWGKLADKFNENVNEGTEKTKDPTGSINEGEHTEGEGGNIKSTSENIKSGAAKTIAGVGLACVALSVSDNAEKIHYLNVVAPLMRLGMSVVSQGNQIMSNQDLNISEVGQAVSHLYDKGTPNLKPGDQGYRAPSSWLDSKSVQAELGKPQTGQDIPDNARTDGESNVLSSLFASAGGVTDGLRGLCSALGSPLGQGLQALLGTVGDYVVGFIQGQIIEQSGVLEWLAGELAGEAINTNSFGQLFGNYANYGVRHAADQQAISLGGRPLTGAEQVALRSAYDQDQHEAAKEKGLGYQLLALDNPDSVLASALGDSSGARESLQQFMDIPQHLQQGFASLFSVFLPKAHAEAVNYDYGFPKFGFSLGELDDDKYDNPFENATHVEPKLDALNKKYGVPCFGVTLAADGGFKLDQSVKDYDTIQNDAACHDGTEDLARYRVYILDSMTASSLACYEGDDVSCGYFFGDAATAAPTTGTAVNGNVYQVGDSLSVGMRDLGNLPASLQTQGWSPTIMAECGRHLVSDGDNCSGQPVLGGLNQVDQPADQTAIKNAGVVVVGLGTNDPGSPSFSGDVTAMIAKIKALNPAAKIYWVNLFSTNENAGTYQAMDGTLSGLATSQGFTVIDWATQAQKVGAYDPGTYHPNNYQAMADFEVSQLGHAP